MAEKYFLAVAETLTVQTPCGPVKNYDVFLSPAKYSGQLREQSQAGLLSGLGRILWYQEFRFKGKMDSAESLMFDVLLPLATGLYTPAKTKRKSEKEQSETQKPKNVFVSDFFRINPRPTKEIFSIRIGILDKDYARLEDTLRGISYILEAA